MRDSADVVVVGAGSTGAATAWQLGERDTGRVLLLEQSALASGATGRSCAILRMHYMHETLTRMALHSLRIFELFDELVGGEAGFRRVGWLSLACPDDAEPLAANVEMHRRVGVDAQLITPSEAAALVPGMRVDDVGAAVWEPDSGYADPHLTAAGFLAAAERRGVEYRPGVGVNALVPAAGSGWRLETSAGSIAAGAVVVAAGFRTLDLVRPLGVELPVEPVRHTIAVVRRSEGFGAEHPIISDRVAGGYYRPESGEQTLVGATAPYDGFTDPEVELDRPADLDALTVLVGRFADRFPPERDPVIGSSYTSIYDCTPDLQPLLGPVGEHDGLHVAVGFSGHGFKLSPAIGELLAEKVTGGTAMVADIDAFRASRFEEGAAFTAPNPYSVPTLG